MKTMICFFGVILSSWPALQTADTIAAGRQAYLKGDYETALKELLPAAT